MSEKRKERNGVKRGDEEHFDGEECKQRRLK